MPQKQKLLYILNVAKRVNNFSYASMVAAKESGFEFHIAGNWSYQSDEERQADEKKYGIRIFQIDFIRTPYHPGNRIAYKQLKSLMQKENYDIVHCNTPIGGVLGRLLAKKCKIQKIIYQAHGFHFFKGAPLKNWLLYYPVERLLAPFTDCLITINHEDYERAKKFNLPKGGRVEYVPGVGIETEKFHRNDEARREIRDALKVKDSETLLLSVGELNQNKNHRIVIEAIAKLGRKDLRYVICGKGPLVDAHKQLVQMLGIEDQVIFAGYRTDVNKFYQAADLFVISSFREGLPVAPMEAMAAELPCIASRIRGNVDLLENSQLLFDPNNVETLIAAINKAMDKNIAKQETEQNAKSLQSYSTEEVVAEMKKIYTSLLN